MVGIGDVARLAEVSVGTVSRVVNGHPAVSERLRAQVLAATDALDWTPNRVARHLRTGRSQSVGLIVVDIAHPFYPEVVRAAEATLETAGLTLFLANTYDDVDREDRLLEVMLKQRVAGVIMSPANGNSTLVEALRRANTPVVFLDAAPVPELGEMCSVYADDVGGGRRAVDHLIELGHRQILLINGPRWMRQCADREAGARQAVEAANIASPYEMSLDVVELDELSYRAGEAMIRLLHDWRWTAIFCSQDAVAVGVQRAIRRAGLRIPADVSVVGYDNVDAAAFAPVPLTTVAKPREQMGRTGALLLVQEIEDARVGEGGHHHVTQSLDTHLVVRESTGSPAS